MKVTAEEKGNRVFDALADSYPEGLTLTDLMATTALSRGQVRGGLTYVRETIAELHAEPVLCIRQPDGSDHYFLAADEDMVASYAVGRFKIAAVQAQNLLTAAVGPGLQKFGNPMLLRFVHKYHRRIIEDLNELVSISGEDGDA